MDNVLYNNTCFMSQGRVYQNNRICIEFIYFELLTIFEKGRTVTGYSIFHPLNLKWITI